jgi:hypothetical protein
MPAMPLIELPLELTVVVDASAYKPPPRPFPEFTIPQPITVEPIGSDPLQINPFLFNPFEVDVVKIVTTPSRSHHGTGHFGLLAEERSEIESLPGTELQWQPSIQPIIPAQQRPKNPFRGCW